MKAIGLASEKRSPSLPDLPTFAEAGIDFTMDYWFGLFTSAATPKPIRERLHAACNAILRSPDIVAGLDKAGLQPMQASADEFAAFVKKDTERWASVVQAAKIKID